MDDGSPPPFADTAGASTTRVFRLPPIDCFNEKAGLKTIAHFPDLDVIRRSRLKKSTLFEMEPSPELEAVQAEYLRLAAALWTGTAIFDGAPLRDRDIFDLLGFD